MSVGIRLFRVALITVSVLIGCGDEPDYFRDLNDNDSTAVLHLPSDRAFSVLKKVGLATSDDQTSAPITEGLSINHEDFSAQPDDFEPKRKSSDLVVNLRAKLIDQGIETPFPETVQSASSPIVKLGQALFFDKILSGNDDVACATCHHPKQGTSDGLPTSIGVDGKGLGLDRAGNTMGEVIPRNAPDLFNRGSSLWKTMFWDARVSTVDAEMVTPAGEALPEGLDNLLAAQAMFPPTSAHEMRGIKGTSPLSDLEGDDFDAIWDNLMDKILTHREYQKLFQLAYPELALQDLGFEHAANAIAAFEVSAFTKLDTPFDRFLQGDDEAMTETEMMGADLFFGEAGCSDCHGGPLLTDQRSYVLATPQLGPGKDERGIDIGTALVSGDENEKFAFRTPPLRNVALTGPYMHAGSYPTLEEALIHHLKPSTALAQYTGAHLNERHRAELLDQSLYADEALAHLSLELESLPDLTRKEIRALVAFLHALTDESARDMSHLIPGSVPSGRGELE